MNTTKYLLITLALMATIIGIAIGTYIVTAPGTAGAGIGVTAGASAGAGIGVTAGAGTQQLAPAHATVQAQLVQQSEELRTRNMQQAEELRKRNIQLASAASMVVLLLLTLWYSVRRTRTVYYKVSALASNIDRQLGYKEKLEKTGKELQQLKQEMEMLEEMLVEGAGASGTGIGTAGTGMELVEESASQQEHDAAAEHKIFDPMAAELRERKLYLNRNFSREDLMRLAGVSKNRIAHIVNACTGMNVNGYLNSLRLEHAVKLMRENPLHTIESIAQDSGLPNTSTFYRLFRERFSITPTEYRKGMEAEE